MLHQIGSGVLGPVFRAFDREADRLIAIKAFHLDVTPEAVARVASGLRALAGRSPHSAIVTPIAAGLEGARAFIALPLVPGESLDARLRQASPLPLDEALRMLAAIAPALDAAAAAGLRHGSLHPRDIIVDAGRRMLHLTGVGIGPVLEAAGVPAPLRRAYAAPERLTPGSPWDARADVYSLAVIAHEILTGRRPVSAGEQDGAFGADVTPEQRVVLRQALARGLAVDPNARFQTATEFVEWLDLVSGPLRRYVVETPRPVEEPAPAPVTAVPLVSAPVASVASAPIAPAPLAAASLSDAPLTSAPLATAPAADVIVRPVHGAVALQSSLQSFGDVAGDTPQIPSGAARRRFARAVMVTAAGVSLGACLGYLVHAARTRPRPAPIAAGPIAGTPSDTEVALAADGSAAQAKPNPAAPAPESAAPPTQPDTAARVMAVTGQLVVRSQPAGAIVTVNGALSGETPATIRDLPLGTHVVKVARPGHAPRTERITLTSTAPAQRIDVALQRGLDLSGPVRGAIDVDSRPRGARVFIDGRYIGVTPLRWPDAAAGAHQVVLEHAGYTRTTIPVTVRQGEPARVVATLRVAAGSKDRE